MLVFKLLQIRNNQIKILCYKNLFSQYRLGYQEILISFILFSADSWLSDNNNNNNNKNDEDSRSGDSGERIYSGRSSPKKQSKEGLTRGISSRTIDSYDNAFNRKPPSASHIHNHDSQQDDFFDS